MSQSRIAEFEASVGEYGTAHRTTAADAESTIADLIEEPAVGAPIPIDDVSLSSLPIELDPTPADLEAAKTGVTVAGLGIAPYGTITIQTTPAGDEPASLFPDRHVAVVAASDIAADMREAMSWIEADVSGDGPSTHILATGPSATADMGELEIGVHGPGEVDIVVVTDR